MPLNNHYKDLRFEALFNSASMGIIVVNGSGDIVMSNHFANKLFGYQEAEIITEKLEKLIPQRYHHAHVQHRDGYVAKPQARTMGLGMTLRALRKDRSEFPVEISLGHFETEESKYVIAFISDITKRQESEEEIRKLNTSLEEKVTRRTEELQKTLIELQASKDSLTKSLEKEKEVNDLKSRFVSMASHEFRTPLSTILSSISLLAKYETTEEQPKRDKHIDRIKSSVKTLTDILNEFLSLGKIEEGKVDVHFESFDLTTFIHGVINEMNVLLKSGQELVHNNKDIAICFSDASLLKHVLINLISNAIKFSPENKTIKIETTIQGDYIQIKVIDQGMGIPEQDQIHLFERFFRATNVTNIQGTGLGLHIVGRYIELLKGKISYQSQLESGSIFCIDLPNQENND
jgi:PAS domain S-box-containing protein